MEINLNNYEELMLTYVDGELDEKTAFALMQFLNAHPDKRKELELLQMTVLPTDKEIHFPDKQLLYREEKSTTKKVFILRRYQWLSAAAAAACIALLVIFYLHPWESSLPASNSVAMNKPTPSANQPSTTLSTIEDTISSSIVASKEEKKSTPGVLAITSSRKTLTKEKTVMNPSNVIPDHKHENEIASPSVKPDLPTLSSPEMALTDSEKDYDLAVVPIMIKEKVNPVNEHKVSKPSDTGSLKSNTRSKGQLMDDKITNATEVLAMAKQGLDSSITRKITDINQKTSGFINNIAKNGIKIGHITFAFNN